MSFLDALFGRGGPSPSKLEALFAMSTAQLSLQTEAQLTLGGQAALCLRPVDTAEFTSAKGDVRDILALSTRDTGTQLETKEDSYGFLWIVLSDPELEDLVSTIHMICLTLEEQGFGERLLAAVFLFLDQGQPVYWIYHYKSGRFYPFVPRGKERDTARELHLRALMDKELPIETDTTKWYALWDLPL